jgi:hypothetical protein
MATYNEEALPARNLRDSQFAMKTSRFLKTYKKLEGLREKAEIM